MRAGRTMKSILIVVWLLTACLAHAADRNNLSELHPSLRLLYQRLIAGARLAGTQHEIEAHLKAANEKAILLEDGYVKSGEGLKYSFLKFERGYKLPDGLQRGQKIRLVFGVIEGRNDATTPGMPYLRARLISLEPED